MEKGDYLDALLRSPKTIFSLGDITLLWGEPRRNTALSRLHYYLKHGKLIRLRQGVYAKDKNYNPMELATKIFIPAYISFETVLIQTGFIFQYYNTIFVASYLTRQVVCGQHAFSFKKIKSSVLTNPLGIELKNEYAIASSERAFLDIIYLNKDYYFDNLSGLNWDKAFELLAIYENKRMQKTMEKIYRQHKADSI
ncbi:MAG: hypothetical protein A3F17_04595 [Gammaproteobacteria bacterium RIFCSPHIGHO2_12_FULL_41_15]|nr:MAG: hypothetical protein A3F17_04595 [Gammaproteobacteria bacterium RIFCSPHIGHO2_12_FULL_41_15]